MQWFAIFALILAGSCWGLGFPLGKLALAELSPGHMVLLRFAIAAAVSAPFALARREARALFRSPPVIAAGVFYGLAFLMQFEGLSGVSVTLAALLVGAMPALIAVCAQAMGERLNRLAWSGVASATLGAALIAGKPEGAGTPFGIALSLASLLVFMGWLLALKRAPQGPTPMAVPAATIVIAALAILPVALVLHGAPSLRLSGIAWAGVAGQGLLSTFLATAAWQFGSTRVGSATAGVFINLEPLLGATLGVLLFGDRLTLPLALGGAMILLGSLAVVMGERKASLALAHDAPATPA
jgi:drug/metabolite transporter (DMT)-like permease